MYVIKALKAQILLPINFYIIVQVSPQMIFQYLSFLSQLTFLSCYCNTCLTGCFYFTIANLPPTVRSKLKAIQALAFAKSEHINKYGICHILKCITADIIQLENICDSVIWQTDKISMIWPSNFENLHIIICHLCNKILDCSVKLSFCQVFANLAKFLPICQIYICYNTV